MPAPSKPATTATMIGRPKLEEERLAEWTGLNSFTGTSSQISGGGLSVLTTGTGFGGGGGGGGFTLRGCVSLRCSENKAESLAMLLLSGADIILTYPSTHDRYSVPCLDRWIRYFS